jgi:hypothetical protein
MLLKKGGKPSLFVFVLLYYEAGVVSVAQVIPVIG